MVREIGQECPIYSLMRVLESDTKECPFCGEAIQARAIKCRYCAEFLNTQEAKVIEAANKGEIQAGGEGEVLFWGRPSLWAMAGPIVKGAVMLAAAIVVMKFSIERWLQSGLGAQLSESQIVTFGKYRVIIGLAIVLSILCMLLIKVVRLKMVYYEVSLDRIEWGRGIFDRQVDNLDMFRVVDLKLRRSLLDCIVGVGTVVLVTTDKSDPQFTFEKVHNPRELYDVIKRASLDADQKQRVVHLE